MSPGRQASSQQNPRPIFSTDGLAQAPRRTAMYKTAIEAAVGTGAQDHSPAEICRSRKVLAHVFVGWLNAPPAGDPPWLPRYGSRYGGRGRPIASWAAQVGVSRDRRPQPIGGTPTSAVHRAALTDRGKPQATVWHNTSTAPNPRWPARLISCRS